MRTAVVVFAKTPELTPVKTRLAAGIGRREADMFYSLSVMALKETLARLQTRVKELSSHQTLDVSVYWALAETEGGSSDFWQDCQTLWTGEGGLGQRLHQVTERLFKDVDAVAMIGTDSPQLTAETLAEALVRLAAQPENTVIGPCSDGGFYFLASTAPLGETLWNSVSYSQSDTLEQLLRRLKESGKTYQLLEPLGDVDEVEDLSRLQEDLTWLEDKLTPSQQRLLAWLREVV